MTFLFQNKADVHQMQGRGTSDWWARIEIENKIEPFDPVRPWLARLTEKRGSTRSFLGRRHHSCAPHRARRVMSNASAEGDLSRANSSNATIDHSQQQQPQVCATFPFQRRNKLRFFTGPWALPPVGFLYQLVALWPLAVAQRNCCTRCLASAEMRGWISGNLGPEISSRRIENSRRWGRYDWGVDVTHPAQNSSYDD